MIELTSTRGTSASARAVCWCRALETRQSINSRKLEDIFAQYFLTDFERLLLRSISNIGTTWIESASLGLYQEIIKRHATTDSWLAESLDSNIQNLLILGAGYDSRGWRFARPGLRTIELDQVLTQTRKQKCLQRFEEYFPKAQVELHAVDFRRSDWAELLPPDSNPSVIVWEGVTMYLEQDEVIATTRAIAQRLRSGAKVIVDVLLPDAPMRASTSITRVGLGLLGEKLKWTIPLQEVASFFQPLGFAVTRSLKLGDHPTRSSHIGLVQLSRL